VHESAVRSAHLVNQLLALTRAEPEAAAALPRAPVDLGVLAAAVASEHVPRALQAGIDLGVDEGGVGVMVMGSEALLREAVSNLVDNAIRYAGRGAEVTLAVRADGPLATLTVSDDGPGLPADLADAHAAIFGRFFRATHEGSGCGLGLAIVREIATRHGGQVRAEPVLPHGLRLRLDLPRLVKN
jgi:two-component system, OmpR family, sensor histidine kinase TctE